MLEEEDEEEELELDDEVELDPVVDVEPGFVLALCMGVEGDPPQPASAAVAKITK